MYDLLIIGGGAAGLSAGMYAGRLNMKTLIFSAQSGGTLALTGEIENWPGEKKITGMDLAMKLEEHAKEYDVEIKNEKVIDIQKDCDCFKVTTDSKEYYAHTVLIATGTKHRKLGIPGETEYQNKGVHQCALCDGAFYQEKKVIVVGGGDSAAKEALILAQYAKKVYLMARGEKLRAEPINLNRIKAETKIEVMTKTKLLEIKGEKFVNEVVLETDGKKKNMAISGVFVEIGRIPLSSIGKNIGIKLNKHGEIIIDRESKTNVIGVYAAGDVADTGFKQAITGSSEGVTAAYNAFTYVNDTEFVCPCGNSK